MERKISLDQKVLRLNKQAMDFLHNEDFEKSLKILKECERLLAEFKLPKSSELWGITYNNFGCVYKKAGTLKTALFYLTKALEMELKTSYDATNLASTHLNISAILSSVSKHEGSLMHALAALKTLQTFVSTSMNYTVSIVIAYHSIGLENEHLRKYTEALTAYKKGWEVAEKELGPDHKLTETLRKSFGKGCNLPTMPVLRPKKRVFVNRKSLNGNRFLPLVSSKNSQKTSFTATKYSNLNRSIETSGTRKTYYLHKRNSLSPMDETSKSKLAGEIDSINRLIKDLDGSIKKPQSDNRKIKAQLLEIPVKKQASRSRKGTYQELIPHVLKIQRWWREMTEPRMPRPQIAFQKKTQKTQKPVLVEPTLRKNLLRPIPEQKFEKKIDAIIKIQSWIRMWLKRKSYKKTLNSIICIQKHARRYHTKKLYKLIRSAIIFIQSVFRGHLVRKRISKPIYP